MITVLVADDDFRVARIHAAFVGAVEGFQVVGSTSNGADTLAAAVRLRPDLILLDLYLPDVFGLDLISQLRVAGVQSDVVVISAANESQTVERALKLGATSYLLKPFTQADLTARLADYRSHQRLSWPDRMGDQQQIDEMFGRLDPRPTTLPKGMSIETAELVLATLTEAEHPLSAQDCADATGVSRVSARRYLEHFAQRGGVEVTLRYGVRGRPERRYQISHRP